MKKSFPDVQVLPYQKGLFESLTASLSGCVYTNQMGKNRFATYQNEETLTHICEYPERGEVRVVTCPLPLYGTRPPKAAEFSKKHPTCLYQIDLDNRRVDCGMSYVFHLADDRFFIIDGGYFTLGECERLYALLRRIQPEGKLPIAGWFFSHAHQDHFGGFLDFISKYKDECVIDTLFYTFPSLSLPEAIYWKQSDNATMREFDYTVAQKLKNTNICFLHTGETFSFADLDFEVLFTHEDIYPDRIGSFNDTSTVLRVTCDGKSILFLGDLQDASCKKLEKMHGSYLKSDAVQVAHHGFNGSTIETYDLVAPELALWPTADYGYHGNKERAVNAHIIAMPCVKEHLIAGIFGTAKLTLPYTPGTAEPIDLPKKA